MAFGANDGQRSDIRMSDMIISLSDIAGGSNNAHSGWFIPSTVTLNSATGMKLSYMYGRTQYTDSDGNGADGGFYSLYNNNTLNTRAGSSVSAYDTYRFTHMQGRYRSATGAPSNSTVQTSGQINMSNLTGISCSALTTDVCGETRGVKAGITSGTTTKTIYGRYQSAVVGHPLKPGVFRDGTTASMGPNTAAHDTIDMALHVGYSAYTTTHTNNWSHLGLNTKICSGDRVIVVAHGGGGTMYTFSNNGPIYLRNSSNNAVSANVSTLAAPHKNTTGSDDNLAVYSAVATGDGATRVLVNPFHSSAQPYIFHVFVIKGPNTTATVSADYTTKYTQYETSVTYSTAPATTGGFTTKQRYFIGVSTSPFNPNSVAGSSQGLGSTQGIDAMYWTSGGAGAGFVTLCNYTGGTQGTQTTDKYGFTYATPTTGFYTPQYGRMIPSQDGRFVKISGTRG